MNQMGFLLVEWFVLAENEQAIMELLTKTSNF